SSARRPTSGTPVPSRGIVLLVTAGLVPLSPISPTISAQFRPGTRYRRNLAVFDDRRDATCVSSQTAGSGCRNARSRAGADAQPAAAALRNPRPRSRSGGCRSEERRVGKERRSGGLADDEQKKRGQCRVVLVHWSAPHADGWV